MTTFDYKDYMKKRVEKALEDTDPSWVKVFVDTHTSSKQEIIWLLKDILEKDGEHKFLDRIMLVSELYSADSDPIPEESDLNKKIEAGEEISFISTVRGTVCWLLAPIAATLETKYYGRIIDCVEKLAHDPVYYVRMQATVPLSFFAANIRARQNRDGTVFDFKNEDRNRVINLSFEMLQKHRDMPRVLESVSRVFDAVRSLNEVQAQQVIDSLFYNSKKELQPEYLTRQAVPLLIFFAEFRSTVGDGFNGIWFQNYAKELLKLPQEQAPYLRSTFEWHVWKELERDSSSYEKLKKYIPFFLHMDVFEQQPLGQYDFLIMQVLKIAPQEGVDLFQGLLNYIDQWAYKYDIRQHAWMLSGGEIIETIAPIAPDKLLALLSQITRILSKGVWVGDLERMFKAYLLIPNKKIQEEIYPQLSQLYDEVKKFDRVGKLGDL